ncbi:MAG: threonylcarbamoyl-AMP synthase [Candidatus Pacebacteria bacterium]|nr:threonylcarbamoyl-AMP synthase [Candidatus Paceibacterota bacterium]
MEVLEKIRRGEVVVMPTDTVYGLACSAFNKDAIERMYEIKERDRSKPFVFLISDIEDLSLFGIEYKKGMEKYWPGPFSIILSCKTSLEYLHRGKNTLAIRLPNDENLINLLRKTGPLATTSCNKEGMEPAKNIDEAKKYFGDEAGFYLDKGVLFGKSSTIVDLSGKVFRE